MFFKKIIICCCFLWKIFEQVSDELRQRAKQVCYGMIYGIGVKALANQLEVDENEAAIFMETFKTSYPGKN